MNIQEAKFILQAYRPNGEDASDPQFAEALRLARVDPELGKWFAEQQVFDAAASRALKDVKIPSHLKESILAGRRVIEPEFWWKWPTVWAMAAAIVLLLGLAAFLLANKKSAQFAVFRKEMTLAADTTDMSKHLGLMASDLGQIQTWLGSKGVEINYSLPPGLRGMPGMGCQVLNWNGNKISMICFVLNGNHVDLFMAEKGDFKGAVPGDKPQFVSNGSDITASWSEADKVYLLVGHGTVDEKLLREYIEPRKTAGGGDQHDSAAGDARLAQE
jgi:uncharacterized membrane protein YbaN (DUF454 family)